MPNTFQIAARRVALATAIACGGQLAVADDTSGQIILRQRNDPNVQADVNASRDAGLLPRLFPDAAAASPPSEEAPTSLSIGEQPETGQPAASATDSLADAEPVDRAGAAASDADAVDLPQYPRGGTGGRVPQADDDATTRPALGSGRSTRDSEEPAAFFTTPRSVSTTVQPAAAIEPAATPQIGGSYGQIYYDQYCRPVVINCVTPDVIQVLPQTPPATVQPSSSEPAESSPDAAEEGSGVSRFESRRPTGQEGNWSDEAIVRRAAEHSEGALQVSEQPDREAAKSQAPPTDITRREALRPTETQLAESSVDRYRPVLPPDSSLDAIAVNPPLATAIQVLAPPKYSYDLAAAPPLTMSVSGATVTARSPTVRYASMQVDPEAAAVPSLPAVDSGVSQAAFQDAMPPNFSPPSYGAPPAAANGFPSVAAPAAIPAPATTVTPLPSNTLPQYSSTPAYDSVPTYPQAPRIVSGEPFVTEAPCQFDASYMVQPAAYAASVCPPAVAAPLAAAATMPGFIASPVVLPNQAPALYAAPAAGGYKRPLIGFGQENYNVVVGRGIIGQPVAYVPGQPVRNFFRYIFP